MNYYYLFLFIIISIYFYLLSFIIFISPFPPEKTDCDDRPSYLLATLQGPRWESNPVTSDPEAR